MLADTAPLKQQWDLVQNLLEKWLNERKELLVLFCNFGSNESATEEGDIFPRWQDVKRFSQALVDYVSAGHFEIYEQLQKEAEVAEDDSGKLVEELYPKIHETTQAALDFNDKYATEEDWEHNHKDLQNDISVLGEELTNRFEMEDRLIAEIHNAHQALID